MGHSHIAEKFFSSAFCEVTPSFYRRESIFYDGHVWRTLISHIPDL
jgi:hypothetical protein